MKVDVWGELVTDCDNCIYSKYVVGLQINACSATNYSRIINTDDITNVQKYCPFTQSITKEVLEQYFRNKECYQYIEVKEDEGCIYLDLYEYEDIRDEFTRVCYAPIQDTDYWGISVYYYTYYKGEEKKYQKHEQIKVTNKVHLIFILNSII